MPKTFTDDIAAALPSALDGPFLVVDPADAANYVKLDPGVGPIEAGGTARPRRAIALPFVRVFSSTTTGSIGVLTTQIVASGANGGYFVAPFRIPADMDVSAPSHVWFLTATGAAGPGSAQVVRFLLADTYVRGAGAATSTTLSYDWSAPVSWALGDNRSVRFDAGSGHTYAGGRFAIDDYVGLRLSRNGVHPNDTYSQSIHLAESVIFEYTAKKF